MNITIDKRNDDYIEVQLPNGVFRFTDVDSNGILSANIRQDKVYSIEELLEVMFHRKNEDLLTIKIYEKS